MSEKEYNQNETHELMGMIIYGALLITLWKYLHFDIVGLSESMFLLLFFVGVVGIPSFGVAFDAIMKKKFENKVIILLIISILLLIVYVGVGLYIINTNYGGDVSGDIIPEFCTAGTSWYYTFTVENGTVTTFLTSSTFGDSNCDGVVVWSTTILSYNTSQLGGKEMTNTCIKIIYRLSKDNE